MSTKIGNSKGIRIPRPVIEECGLSDKVELRVEKGKLIISPEPPPRADWAAKSERAFGAKISSNFDNEEWEW